MFVGSLIILRNSDKSSSRTIIPFPFRYLRPFRAAQTGGSQLIVEIEAEQPGEMRGACDRTCFSICLFVCIHA